MEIEIAGQIACADTKCKLEETARSERTVVSTLEEAREQLPRDKPGMVFVSLPQQWAIDDGVELTNFLKNSTEQFLRRGTQRIVSVKYHASMIYETRGKVWPIIFVAEFHNHHHRFSQGIDWSVFSEMDRAPEFWTCLVEACSGGPAEQGGSTYEQIPKGG